MFDSSTHFTDSMQAVSRRNSGGGQNSLALIRRANDPGYLAHGTRSTDLDFNLFKDPVFEALPFEDYELHNTMLTRQLLSGIMIGNTLSHLEYVPRPNHSAGFRVNASDWQSMYYCKVTGGTKASYYYLSGQMIHDFIASRCSQMPETCPPELFCMMLEDAYASVLDGLCDGGQAKIESCKRVNELPPLDFSCLRGVNQANGASVITLWVDSDTLVHHVKGRGDSLQYLRAVDHRDIKIPCRFAIGKMEIEPALFSKFSCGDVLVTELTDAIEKAELYLGHRVVIPIDCLDDAFSVSSQWENIVNQEKNTSNAAADEHVPIDSLPVRVVFEIAERELPLGELESYRPGFVFSWPGLNSESVKIRANGKLIGKGKLVQVGEKLGVQLLEKSDGRT